MAAKYGFECDEVKLVFHREETGLQFFSGGEMVKSQKIQYSCPKPGDTLSIRMCCFAYDEPKRMYTVDDLMKMVAEKMEK